MAFIKPKDNPLQQTSPGNSEHTIYIKNKFTNWNKKRNGGAEEKGAGGAVK